MANLAFLFDAPMMTADNSVKTHGGHPGAEKPPSHVYRYMMATAPPIVCWIAGNPYTEIMLARRRARLEAALTVVEVQAPAQEAAA